MKNLLLAAALVAAPLCAQAAVVADQQNPTTTGNTAVGIVTTDLGQTFTVGVDGIFAGVTVDAFTQSAMTADLTVTLRSVTSGLPSATSLATTTLSALAANAGPSDYIDFSFANVAVNIGDVLAVVFSSSIGEHWFIDSDSAASYLSGTRVASNDGGASFSNVGGDLTFATFVDDGTEVPLPAAAPLMAAGLAGLFAASRRRKG